MTFQTDTQFGNKLGYRFRKRLYRTSLTSGGYLVVGIDDSTVTIKMPVSLSAMIIVLGDNSPAITTESSTLQTLDENGVAWH